MHVQELMTILYGVMGSVIAAFIVWVFWCVRIRLAARKYCGNWQLWKLNERNIVRGTPDEIAQIRPAWNWWNPLTWLSPEKLRLDANNNLPAVGGFEYEGDIAINPVATNRATVTLSRRGNSKEYAVQDYFLLANGDIYVVPAGSDVRPPEYSKHVLRRIV
jgi:hypothetical protein